VIKQGRIEWVEQLVVLVVDGGWRCFHSDITSHARRNPELLTCPKSCSAVSPWHLRQNQSTQSSKSMPSYHCNIYIHKKLSESVRILYICLPV